MGTFTYLFCIMKQRTEISAITIIPVCFETKVVYIANSIEMIGISHFFDVWQETIIMNKESYIYTSLDERKINTHEEKITGQMILSGISFSNVLVFICH